MRKLVLLLFRSAFMLLTVAMVIKADSITIISVPVGLDGGDAVALGGGGGVLGQSWSSSNSYVNVNISAALTRGLCCPTDPIVSVIAYLTSQIGPGTTIADQIATATVPVPGPGPNATYTTLFSGLTLGPGNYFLTLAAADPTDAGTAAWWYDSFARILTDTGVAWLGKYGTNSPDSSYPPATLFSLQTKDGTGLQVTGDPPSNVPEPSTFRPFALGLFVLLNLRIISASWSYRAR
jgi:hypothetical protein